MFNKLEEYPSGEGTALEMQQVMKVAREFDPLLLRHGSCQLIGWQLSSFFASNSRPKPCPIAFAESTLEL